MRVGSNLSGIDMTAQHNLMRSLSMVNKASTRMATLKRINSGGDDPAGLIALENMQAIFIRLRFPSPKNEVAGYYPTR